MMLEGHVVRALAIWKDFRSQLQCLCPEEGRLQAAPKPERYSGDALKEGEARPHFRSGT